MYAVNVTVYVDIEQERNGVDQAIYEVVKALDGVVDDGLDSPIEDFDIEQGWLM